MYIGNFSQDNQNLQQDSNFKVVFTYPGVPKPVPLTNAIRKGNSIAFFFRTIPTDEEFKKLIKFAEGDFVNPAPHIAKKVHKKCFQRNGESWEEIQFNLD